MYLSSKTRKIYEVRLAELLEQRAALAEEKRMARENNAGYEEKQLATAKINEDIARLSGEIASVEQILREAVMVKRDSGLDDKVDIGDRVTVLYEGETEPRTYTLVSTYLNLDNVKETSTESPLGAAIWKKHVGDVCSYVVDNKRRRTKKEYKLTIVGLENVEDLTTELENE